MILGTLSRSWCQKERRDWKGDLGYFAQRRKDGLACRTDAGPLRVVTRRPGEVAHAEAREVDQRRADLILAPAARYVSTHHSVSAHHSGSRRASLSTKRPKKTRAQRYPWGKQVIILKQVQWGGERRRAQHGEQAAPAQPHVDLDARQIGRVARVAAPLPLPDFLSRERERETRFGARRCVRLSRP